MRITALNRQGGGALFGTDGIDIKTSSQLLYILNNILHRQNLAEGETIYNTPRTFTSVDFANYTPGGDTYTDAAIYIRLFEPLFGLNETVRFTTSMHVDHGEVGKGKWWRVVYMKDGILTLWMADPYKDARQTSTNPLATVRTELLNDINSVLTNCHQNVSDAIALPSVVTSHQSQPVTTLSGIDFSNPNVANTDQVWMPSMYEVDTLWNVSALNRAHLGGELYASTWLRSNYSTGYTVIQKWTHTHSGYSGYECNLKRATVNNSILKPTGASATAKTTLYSTYTCGWCGNWTGGTIPSNVLVTIEASVRPAIHIDLNKLPDYGDPVIQAEVM